MGSKNENLAKWGQTCQKSKTWGLKLAFTQYIKPADIHTCHSFSHLANSERALRKCAILYNRVREREREISQHMWGSFRQWAWLIGVFPLEFGFPHVASTSLIRLHETPPCAISCTRSCSDWTFLDHSQSLPNKVLRIHFPSVLIGEFFIHISSFPSRSYFHFGVNVGLSAFSSDATRVGLYRVRLFVYGAPFSRNPLHSAANSSVLIRRIQKPVSESDSHFWVFLIGGALLYFCLG